MNMKINDKTKSQGFIDHEGSLDSKVHGANMGPIWGRQDPGGPHVGPINSDISVSIKLC